MVKNKQVPVRVRFEKAGMPLTGVLMVDHQGYQVCAGLVVCRMLDWDPDEHRFVVTSRREWMIIHTASGTKIGPVFYGKGFAVAAAQAVAGMVDWTVPSIRDLAALPVAVEIKRVLRGGIGVEGEFLVVEEGG